MKKRIYLSGPITGKPIEEAQADFQAAEEVVRKTVHTVYNPLAEVPEYFRLHKGFNYNLLNGYYATDINSWSDCMRIVLREMLLCHEIQMLPGWRDSKGAKLEHHIALALGMPATYPEGEEPEKEDQEIIRELRKIAFGTGSAAERMVEVKTIFSGSEEPHERTTGFPEINWSKLRRRFFDQCTDPVDGNSGIRKINMAPHDLLEWLRENITDCPQMVWLDRKPNLTDLATEFTNWSRTAFPEADWGNSLDKLSQEIDEVWEATTSESDHGVALELADCLMCIFDSASRLGINSQMLTEAFAKKLKQNKQRKWQRNADGTYSHVK